MKVNEVWEIIQKYACRVLYCFVWNYVADRLTAFMEHFSKTTSIWKAANDDFWYGKISKEVLEHMLHLFSMYCCIKIAQYFIRKVFITQLQNLFAPIIAPPPKPWSQRVIAWIRAKRNVGLHLLR